MVGCGTGLSGGTRVREAYRKGSIMVGCDASLGGGTQVRKACKRGFVASYWYYGLVGWDCSPCCYVLALGIMFPSLSNKKH